MLKELVIEMVSAFNAVSKKEKESNPEANELLQRLLQKLKILVDPRTIFPEEILDGEYVTAKKR